MSMSVREHVHTGAQVHTHTHERQYAGVLRLRADVFLETGVKSHVELDSRGMQEGSTSSCPRCLVFCCAGLSRSVVYNSLQARQAPLSMGILQARILE